MHLGEVLGEVRSLLRKVLPSIVAVDVEVERALATVLLLKFIEAIFTSLLFLLVLIAHIGMLCDARVFAPVIAVDAMMLVEQFKPVTGERFDVGNVGRAVLIVHIGQVLVLTLPLVLHVGAIAVVLVAVLLELLVLVAGIYLMVVILRRAALWVFSVPVLTVGVTEAFAILVVVNLEQCVAIVWLTSALQRFGDVGARNIAGNILVFLVAVVIVPIVGS